MIDLGVCGFRLFCALSDGWTITEDVSLMGFPAMTLRNVHERQWMDQVIGVVLSYIGYVNRTVWRRG